MTAILQTPFQLSRLRTSARHEQNYVCNVQVRNLIFMYKGPYAYIEFSMDHTG